MYHQRLQMYFRLIFIAIVNKAFGFDSQKKKKIMVYLRIVYLAETENFLLKI